MQYNRHTVLVAWGGSFLHIQQLTYFVAIQKTESFSLAADDLCVSQSTISKQIKALEDELGTILFNRKSRTITLTPAGQDFLVYAERMLQHYEDVHSAMKRHVQPDQGSLTIAAIPVMAQYGMTSKVAAFCKTFPHIHLNIIEIENDLILSMLRNAEIDLALVRDNYVPEEFETYPLINDELALIASERHPFAKRMSIDLAEAAHEQFILLNQTSGIYQTCLDECRKAGFTPNIKFTSSRIETMIGWVSQDMGISMVMRKVMEHFRLDGVRIIPINNPAYSTLVLAAPKQRTLSTTAKVFLKYMQ